MNKIYREPEYTIVSDENSEAKYLENRNNIKEILLKENKIEELKKEIW